MSSSCRWAVEDLLDQLDLGRERRLADRRGHDVARDGQPRAFELVALVVDLGGERFELAPRSAEDVEVVRRIEPQREHVERSRVRRLGKAEGRGIDALPLGAGRDVDARKGRTVARGPQLLRLRDARARNVERRAVGERALHERIHLARLEHLPPFRGNVARDESHFRRGTRDVAIGRGRIGRAKIRADGAAREQHCGQDDAEFQSSVLL